MLAATEGHRQRKRTAKKEKSMLFVVVSDMKEWHHLTLITISIQAIIDCNRAEVLKLTISKNN